METREVKISEVKNLVGSLLTVIEAVCQDIKQREAAKIIIKQTVFRWFNRKEQNSEENDLHAERK